MKLLVILCSLSLSLYGMQDIVYDRLTLSHLESLLQLVNEQAIHDRDKIVILPKLFRERALKGGIHQGRYFGALRNDSVVGYKKLFIVDDDSERFELLKDEIRCLDAYRQLVASGRGVGSGFNYEAVELIPFEYDDAKSVVIYNGADFTSPQLRGKGMNNALTHQAFDCLKNDVVDAIRKKNAFFLILAYGVTRDNSYRTKGIGLSFASFLQKLKDNGLNFSGSIDHYAYKAYKPSFDPDATECIPLPDDQAIEGTGNILIAKIEGALS